MARGLNFSNVPFGHQHLAGKTAWTKKSEEVNQFLSRIPSEKIFITDFSFHSISIALLRLNKPKLLKEFVQDLFVEGSVGLVHLGPEDTDRIIEVYEQFGLDYDDAYQYVSAEKLNLELVSFDTDFNKTPKGRKSPGEVI